MKSTNIERKGKEIKKDELIQLAKDEADINFDLELEIIEQLQNKHKEFGRPGETIIDFIKRIDINELIKLELSGGGKVISITDYLKHKERPRIKRLNLDSVAPNKAISNLTEAELAVVRDLLRRSFSQED
ncbi:hypothetical protein HOF60_02240 [bacterium]|jgi:hypothetical protein|nr:hypothetical protein [bacterium]